MIKFSLQPFPGQDSGEVRIQGAIARTTEALALSFYLQGNLDDLVLPPETVRTRRDNLWQATCFELFWAEEGKKNYWELNLAPNGAWNIYAFSDYREGMRREQGIAEPFMEIKPAPESLLLRSELELGNILPHAPPLRVGVSAVLKDRHSRLSYWALTHSGDKPDFHAQSGFLLRV